VQTCALPIWSDLTKGKAIAYYTANDDTTTITGVYNKPDATSSDWLKLTNGKAIVYYTAKGKDGKTYVTGYVGEGGKSQSVFDVDQINPESLEYHLIYRQGDNKNNRSEEHTSELQSRFDIVCRLLLEKTKT